MTTTQMKHDAEWLLHREMVINDLMLQNGRNRGRDRFRTEVFSDDASPDEKAAAARVLTRLANKMGASNDDLGQALEALGLAPSEATPAPPTTTRRKLNRKRREEKPRHRVRVLCSECERRIEVGASGALLAHSRYAKRPSTVSTCPGSRRLPAGVAA